MSCARCRLSPQERGVSIDRGEVEEHVPEKGSPGFWSCFPSLPAGTLSPELSTPWEHVAVSNRGSKPVKVEFQVPVTEDKTGTVHPAFRWEMLYAELLKTFGGWTFEGEKLGEWIDPETNAPVREVSRGFSVDVPEDRINELIRILERACGTFEQQCIRVSWLGRSELIWRSSDDDYL